MKNIKARSLGKFLKKLRNEKGYSIKKMASELDIDYSYLSKIENSHSLPSDELVEKLGKFFKYDSEELMVRAGRLPEDVISIISNNPKTAIEFLRKNIKE